VKTAHALLARLAAACVLLIAGVGATTAYARQQAPPEAREQAGERHILVMVRLSADHYRPDASYGGDYGDQTAQTIRRRIAQRLAKRHGLELVGDGWPMPLIGLDCFEMRVPDGQSVATVVAEIAKEPEVAWAQPLQTFHTLGRVEKGGAAAGAAEQNPDPLLAVQPATKAWRLVDLHRVATGRGVVVAVVDSRVEANHPDLFGQIVASEDFVPDRPGSAERHGTGVAGVIAAKAGNGVGIAGVAPDAKLMALRACWQGEGDAALTYCNSLSLSEAIHFAIEHGAGVINLSLTGPTDLLLKKLLEVAATRRIAVVAAYDAAAPHGGFPASEPGVIAVANESLPEPPSNVYVALGEDVPTTQPGGRWGLVNGSSYAAAHVSGLVALVREDRPPMARPLLAAARANGGYVDACATLLKASKPCDCACPPPAQSFQMGR
jgi:hypothetical protein